MQLTGESQRPWKPFAVSHSPFSGCVTSSCDPKRHFGGLRMRTLFGGWPPAATDATPLPLRVSLSCPKLQSMRIWLQERRTLSRSPRIALFHGLPPAVRVLLGNDAVGRSLIYYTICNNRHCRSLVHTMNNSKIFEEVPTESANERVSSKRCGRRTGYGLSIHPIAPFLVAGATS